MEEKTIDNFIFQLEDLSKKWTEPSIPIHDIKQIIAEFDLSQKATYLSNSRKAPVRDLIAQRTAFFDNLLTMLWVRLALEGEYTLIGVGGYGRHELFPRSDIDLLILCANVDQAHANENLLNFMRSLWDFGLQIGSSVREIKHCQEAIKNDVNFATAVLESHFICGNNKLFDVFKEATKPGKIIDSFMFYDLKIKEQNKRYTRFEETAYNVEPNVKENPGGLRDIHNIMWIAKFHFSDQSVRDLADHGYLTRQEFRTLDQSRRFLWNVRFALHILRKQDDNRLLFEMQRKIAELLGYETTTTKLGVEHFMHHYYRCARNIQILNQLILQHFSDDILPNETTSPIKELNSRFQIRNNHLEARSDDVFKYAKFAILEVFLILQKNVHLSGISARTIRAIHHNLDIIDQNFRNDKRHLKLFMEILQQPQGVVKAFREMHKHGVLAAFLPPFSHIQGLMQFDLFHVYTVDAHTIIVLRNVRRFFIEEFAHEHPQAHNITKKLPKPHLLYISCLFHDIAKGRNGKHEILGAREVEKFCRHVNLSEYDTHTCSWVVLNHLQLSLIAQKKNLNDPRVIEEFSSTIPSVHHLNMLYLLTIADVEGTSPTLWNSYKDSLFTKLWKSAQIWLEDQGNLEDVVIDDEYSIERNQDEAMHQLRAFMPSSDAEVIWELLPSQYFLNHSPDQICWHTYNIFNISDKEAIESRLNTDSSATEIMVYYPRSPYQFACIVDAINSAGYNIVQASVTRNQNYYALTTCTVLTPENKPIYNEKALDALNLLIQNNLKELGRKGLSALRSTRRINDRRARQFNIPTKITLSTNKLTHNTELTIVCRDRPGLLSIITKELSNLNLLVIGARIRTMGFRVEDIFTITCNNQKPIVDQDILRNIQLRLKNQLDHS